MKITNFLIGDRVCIRNFHHCGDICWARIIGVIVDTNAPYFVFKMDNGNKSIFFMDDENFKLVYHRSLVLDFPMLVEI